MSGKITNLPGVVSVHSVLDQLLRDQQNIECIVGVVMYKDSKGNPTDISMFCSDMTTERLAFCVMKLQNDVSRNIFDDEEIEITIGD